MSDKSSGKPAGTPGSPASPSSRGAVPEWVAGMRRFEKTDRGRVAAQLTNTLVPYAAILTLMYLTIAWGLPYGITLLLAVPASALLVRIFIFFHDCGHGSFVSSPGAQRFLGGLLGVLVFTPFADWRRSHGIHHSTSGNLDRRGVGDIWTMTVAEFEGSSPLRRLRYRLFRNPLVMFGLGPFFIFILGNRVPSRGAGRSQVLSVLITDLIIAGIMIAAGLTIGIKAYAMIQLPVMLLGGAGGVWLFYVQHQFDPSYWARSESWGSVEAAMQGSSYYKLPAVLRWISGNIGFHHIHHLRPRIPNYNLQDCLKATPELQLPHPLRLGESLKSVRLKLWDESSRELLSFRQAVRRRRSRPTLA
jgi:acyl-lipid omega-6 desaturase (Delta-12 desaturase)